MAGSLERYLARPDDLTGNDKLSSRIAVQNHRTYGQQIIAFTYTVEISATECKCPEVIVDGLQQRLGRIQPRQDVIVE